MWTSTLKVLNMCMMQETLFRLLVTVLLSNLFSMLTKERAGLAQEPGQGSSQAVHSNSPSVFPTRVNSSACLAAALGGENTIKNNISSSFF